MRSIWSPFYEYRPLSKERREKMRKAQLARLGIPEGHRKLYGLILPEKLAAAIRPLACSVAKLKGPQEASETVRQMSAMSVEEIKNVTENYFLTNHRLGVRSVSAGRSTAAERGKWAQELLAAGPPMSQAMRKRLSAID